MKRDFVYWIGGSIFEMFVVLLTTKLVNFLLNGYFHYNIPNAVLIAGRLVVGIAAFAFAKLFDILCESEEYEREDE